MSTGIYILLGSNLGDKVGNVDEARRLLGHWVVIRKSSGLYQSEPWGKADQPEFINQVVEIGTSLPPLELFGVTTTIEQKMGRQRTEKWGARVIDIDLLFYHAVILDTPELTLPHPQIPYRRFTLVPLCEIERDLVHPVTHQTVDTMLKECNDPLKIVRIQ